MSPHAVSPEAADVSDHGTQSNPPDGQTAGEVYDMVCIGFGPAALAIAIAINDARQSRRPLPGLNKLYHQAPKVLFLERQSSFGWHEGMLLPGAKMQISFVKDLATLRDPRSEFTFLNYLHTKRRLEHFTNLDTFLPQRVEFADYLEWCASHFDDVVRYGQEVVRVDKYEARDGQCGLVDHFSIEVRDLESDTSRSVLAKNVVLATGGQPQIPEPFPQHHPRVLHSSDYLHAIGKALPDARGYYNVAVVGSGQSAAECFHDLHTRYPNASTKLLIRGAALRPSDDSPFVNEIFDADQVNAFYEKTPEQRATAIAEDRGTNYGVVRGGLLQDLYDELYTQRIHQPDEERWQHRILKHRNVVNATPSPDGIKLEVQNLVDARIETLGVDAVVVAAGYRRDAHERILAPLRGLTASKEHFNVHRDYSVDMDDARVSRKARIWLQGCNQSTHGLSDTLLSILAVRGGELVESMFGDHNEGSKDE